MDTQIILLTLIGIFASTLGTLAGGGGLITLPAMMLFGIPIHTGIATNKISTAVGSFTSLIYLLRKRELTVRMILSILAIAFLGGVCGAYSTSHIPENAMNWVVLFLLLIAFFVSLKNKSWTSSISQETSHNGWKNKVFPFMIGTYDGGFGPGSTTFAILYFMKGNQNYIKSVQFSRVLIFGSCFGAFLVFYQTGYLNWHYAIAMAIGSTIGSQIGLVILPYVPLRVAKILLTSILVLLMGQISFQLI